MSNAHDEQREAIIAAAVELLGTGGAQALRVRDIAAAAGCTTMAVYSRLGGKNGLLQEVYTYSYRSFTQALESATAEFVGSQLDHALRLCDVYRSWALDNEGPYALMFTEVVPGFEPSEAAWAVALGAFQLLVDAVIELQADGEIRTGDPVQIAWAIWGVLHGLVMLEMADVRPVETTAHQTIYTTAVAAIFRGFAP